MISDSGEGTRNVYFENGFNPMGTSEGLLITSPAIMSSSQAEEAFLAFLLPDFLLTGDASN